MKLLRRLRDWLRPVVPYLNVLLVAGCYIANEYFVQGFCQPVPWVWWVLGLTVSAFLAWPWLGSAPQRVRQLAWFLQGLFLPVCLYCALFIALDPQLYLYGLLACFLGFPLLVWTPAFFLWQLRRRQTTVIPHARRLFLAGALSLVPFYLVAQLQLIQFWWVMAQVQAQHLDQVTDLARVWPRTYMSERILGLSWRYHTSPEFIFDGWRPPLHDPMVNVALALPLSLLFSDVSFPELSLDQRAEVYHLVFTDRPTKPDCVCAHLTDAEGYLRWHSEWNDPKGTVKRMGRAGLFGDEATALAADSVASAAAIAFGREFEKHKKAANIADSTRAASHP